jgi:hypothetical protein
MKASIVVVGLGLVALGAAFACGGGTPAPASATVAPGGSKNQNDWPADDKSLCNTVVSWRSHPEYDVEETAGPGALRPNIRHIFKWIGESDQRHKSLICREIDVNLDGIKDVVRTFNDKGDPVHEEADRNYDGRIDDWIDFVDGRIAKEAEDQRNPPLGSPDVCKFYKEGVLSRIRRNTHCAYPRIDCRVDKPTSSDTWEVYTNGVLSRIGQDTTCDGHIDRWDRDTVAEAAQKRAEQALIDAQNAANDAGTTDGGGDAQ